MLTDADKHEAIEAIALAITLNEPEQMIERLRHVCRSKANGPDGHRWLNAADALNEAMAAVTAANQPPPRADADFAPAAKAE